MFEDTLGRHAERIAGSGHRASNEELVVLLQEDLAGPGLGIGKRNSSD
jgi:hypothetical protein